jgi:hypothetical protein
MGEPNKVLLPVRHDAHSAFADLQCKHKRGNGVAGFMVSRAFVLASPALHWPSCVTGNHRWVLGHIAKPTHKTAKIT